MTWLSKKTKKKIFLLVLEKAERLHNRKDSPLLAVFILFLSESFLVIFFTPHRPTTSTRTLTLCLIRFRTETLISLTISVVSLSTWTTTTASRGEELLGKTIRQAINAVELTQRSWWRTSLKTTASSPKMTTTIGAEEEFGKTIGQRIKWWWWTSLETTAYRLVTMTTHASFLFHWVCDHQHPTPLRSRRRRFV